MQTWSGLTSQGMHQPWYDKRPQNQYGSGSLPEMPIQPVSTFFSFSLGHEVFSGLAWNAHHNRSRILDKFSSQKVLYDLFGVDVSLNLDITHSVLCMTICNNSSVNRRYLPDLATRTIPLFSTVTSCGFTTLTWSRQAIVHHCDKISPSVSAYSLLTVTALAV